ncbi:MAG TPA: hypothetical protein VFQ60_03260 [Patescibacteria group bacterium]|nr:hypothetical protein [Patescibacteria group bacterium]
MGFRMELTQRPEIRLSLQLILRPPFENLFRIWAQAPHQILHLGPYGQIEFVICDPRHFREVDAEEHYGIYLDGMIFVSTETPVPWIPFVVLHEWAEWHAGRGEYHPPIENVFPTESHQTLSEAEYKHMSALYAEIRLASDLISPEEFAAYMQWRSSVERTRYFDLDQEAKHYLEEYRRGLSLPYRPSFWKRLSIGIAFNAAIDYDTAHGLGVSHTDLLLSEIRSSSIALEQVYAVLVLVAHLDEKTEALVPRELASAANYLTREVKRPLLCDRDQGDLLFIRQRDGRTRQTVTALMRTLARWQNRALQEAIKNQSARQLPVPAPKPDDHPTEARASVETADLPGGTSGARDSGEESRSREASPAEEIPSASAEEMPSAPAEAPRVEPAASARPAETSSSQAGDEIGSADLSGPGDKQRDEKQIPEPTEVSVMPSGTSGQNQVKVVRAIALSPQDAFFLHLLAQEKQEEAKKAAPLVEKNLRRMLVSVGLITSSGETKAKRWRLERDQAEQTQFLPYEGGQGGKHFPKFEPMMRDRDAWLRDLEKLSGAGKSEAKPAKPASPKSPKKETAKPKKEKLAKEAGSAKPASPTSVPVSALDAEATDLDLLIKFVMSRLPGDFKAGPEKLRGLLVQMGLPDKLQRVRNLASAERDLAELETRKRQLEQAREEALASLNKVPPLIEKLLLLRDEIDSSLK